MEGAKARRDPRRAICLGAGMRKTLYALIISILVGAAPVSAGQWSLDVKGGLSVPIRTTPDGTYWQEAYPHNTRLMTWAYAIGINYAVTPALSFQAHYLYLGSSRINGRAISDENYDHNAHKCLAADCATVYQYSFQATDSLRGVDLTATYAWPREGLTPFVKGGLAVLQHRAKFRNDLGGADTFNGILPEIEIGAGLAYQWTYLELDYFQGINFGGQNLPISTQQIVLFAGVKIPFPGGQ